MTVNLKNISLLEKWLICLSGSFFFFFVFTQMSIFNSISQDLVKTFHLTASQLGLFSAFYLFGIVIFFFPSSYLLERYSTKLVLLSSLIIAILSTILFISTKNLMIAELGRLLTGMMHAVAFLGCCRLVSLWLPSSMGFAMGTVVTIGFLGGLVAQAPMVLLIKERGWQQAEWILILFAIVTFFLMLILIKDYPEQGNQVKANKSSFLYGLKKIVSSPKNWICSFYTTFLNLPIILLGSLWGNLYLSVNHQFSRVQASCVISMLYLGIIVGSPAVGKISDYLKRRKLLMVFGSIFAFLIILLIVLIPHLTLLFSGLLFFFLGIFASTETLSYPAITESNHSDIANTAVGFASIVVIGGGAILQFISGIFLESLMKIQVGSITIHLNQFAYYIIPIAVFLSFILSLTIKENHRNFI